MEGPDGLTILPFVRGNSLKTFLFFLIKVFVLVGPEQIIITLREVSITNTRYKIVTVL